MPHAEGLIAKNQTSLWPPTPGRGTDPTPAGHAHTPAPRPTHGTHAGISSMDLNRRVHSRIRLSNCEGLSCAGTLCPSPAGTATDPGEGTGTESPTPPSGRPSALTVVSRRCAAAVTGGTSGPWGAAGHAPQAQAQHSRAGWEHGALYQATGSGGRSSAPPLGSLPWSPPLLFPPLPSPLQG